MKSITQIREIKTKNEAGWQPASRNNSSKQKGDPYGSPSCLLSAAVRVRAPVRDIDSAGVLPTFDDEGLHGEIIVNISTL
jgi:hypothetical protein